MRYFAGVTPTCTVVKEKVCDGFDDCLDRSDEKGCSCPKHTFKCACFDSAVGCPFKTGCITIYALCNGINECGDWSDEQPCKCEKTSFPCHCHDSGCPGHQPCIRSGKVCDGVDDCGDGSDEKNCSGEVFGLLR